MIRRHPLLAVSIRIGMTMLQTARRAYWFVTRPRTRGVAVIALTPEGQVILVRHSYARGWRLPGGGVGRGEDSLAAAQRELREEIGMTASGEWRLLAEEQHRPDFKRDTLSIYCARDVRYAPRPSLEIEEIAAFAADGLPGGATNMTRRLVATFVTAP
jgi:8-oxo-dGTP pyrophosphatase MutT (NUDIX family)